MTPPPSLPEQELYLLRSSIEAALRQARVGELACGYDALRYGLAHAEATLAEGELWAPELIVRYREALGGYCREFGVSLE